MENLDTIPATQESVWAAFRETDRLIKELRTERAEASARFDREMEKSNADYDRWRKESNAEYDRLRKESNADFDRRMKESDARFEKSSADFDKRMKKLEEVTGGISNNQGFFAEEYFFNSFEKGNQNFFGEKFDDIERNIKGIKPGFKDEYDILLINGKSIGIVEVKFKAHKNDVPGVLRKAETFRRNFPDYEKHQVFLGMATMAFYPELEEECRKEGIAIVKQVGDTVVINDEHLKVF